MITRSHLRRFWEQLQTGVEVVVGTPSPAKLLGVRDGFLRYFHRALGGSMPIAVVPGGDLERTRSGLALDDREILEAARKEAHEAEQRLAGQYHFFVGVEEGLLGMRAGDEKRHLVRTWAVVIGLGDEAWGSSGSLQIPEAVFTSAQTPTSLLETPGRRRQGGMVASLSGGIDSRRSAGALATANALGSLLYGVLAVRRSG